MPEKTVRVEVRAEPKLKADYAQFCRDVMGQTISERTRELWRHDMLWQGIPERPEKESAA